MFGRDLKNESLLNLLLRVGRAARLRLRGRLFTLSGSFAPGSGANFAAGGGLRMINSRGIRIGDDVSVGELCRLECHYPGGYSSAEQPKIVIGDKASFGDLLHIGAINRITIGENLLCASKVIIIDHDHGRCGRELPALAAVPPRERELFSKGEIVIGKNVWLGEGVTVLGGSVIGDGAVIGANAVVCGSVPPGTVFTSKKG